MLNADDPVTEGNGNTHDYSECDYYLACTKKVDFGSGICDDDDDIASKGLYLNLFEHLCEYFQFNRILFKHWNLVGRFLGISPSTKTIVFGSKNLKKEIICVLQTTHQVPSKFQNRNPDSFGTGLSLCLTFYCEDDFDAYDAHDSNEGDYDYDLAAVFLI